jgi:transcriptional regulator with XRE-family HTH domain
LLEKITFRQHKQMLKSSADLARKLRLAMDESKLGQNDVARACDVTQGAVSQWRQNGRIAKKHLPTLARLFKKPLSWWLDVDGGYLGLSETDESTSQKGVVPSAYPAPVKELIELFPLFTPLQRQILEMLLAEARTTLSANATEKMTRLATQARASMKRRSEE